MYKNKIDETIEKIIDDFLKSNIKKIQDFCKDVNFIKYQNDINDILKKFFSQINRKEFKDINDEIYNNIVEIIKKYISYCLFLVIGFFYTGKYDTFVNNIIEFSKNQVGFNLKIKNFFNSESNANILKYFTLIRNIIENKKGENNENVVKYIKKIDLTISNKNDLAQNLIKEIIINEQYTNIDKKDIYLYLEKNEMEVGEYIYIDIVVPTMNVINYDDIEFMLTEREIKHGVGDDIYNMLIEEGELLNITEKVKDIHSNKILTLINNKILIPISEDFLLYHKNDVKYESDIKISQKKKDQTNIKYIVDKIEDASNNTEKSKDKFYVSMKNKRVVLINHYENINIFNRLNNQGKSAIMNNEYYYDLYNYMRYPFINFKTFKKYGFGLHMDKTVDVVRSVTFEEKNSELLFRVGCLDQLVNITGFILNSNISPLQCFKTNQLIDIRKINYKKGNTDNIIVNGYQSVIKYIKTIMLKDKTAPPVFWLFDLHHDKFKLKNYDASNNLSNNELIKLGVSNIYDELVAVIVHKIAKFINKTKSVQLQYFDKLIEIFEKKIMPFPKNIINFIDLKNFVYYDKFIAEKNIYDKKEDIFFGLYGDIIKLPILPPKKPKKEYIISTKSETKSDQYTEYEKIAAICQHNVSWDKIYQLRKKDPNKFSSLLYEFIEQYIMVNYENDFICKSCSTLINIKNYIQDGSFDSEGHFITLLTPVDIKLDDIPEYSKYKSSIRNIEKIVEKIAAVSNIYTLTGTTKTIKSRIHVIVKNVIDLITIHNANLKFVYKERIEKIKNKYNINKDLTNLFYFELDNSIFVYSSKDKDYFKIIKRNNILAYSILLILLELSDSQLLYFSGDKICNIDTFEKYGHKWFSDISIITNNKGDVSPLSNYPVLSYVIFYLSCLIIKYNMWQYDFDDTENKKRKFDPSVQKIIIYTFVDLVNSILEINTKKNYIYEIISNKIYLKLSTTFKNMEIFNKIKSIEKNKDQKKKTMDKTGFSKESVKLQDEYNASDYFGPAKWITSMNTIYTIKNRKYDYPKYFKISGTTNCKSGTFHEWKPKGTTFVCTKCGTLIDQTKNDDEKKIIDNYILINLKQITDKYCSSNILHNFMYDKKNQCDVCKTCKYIKNNDNNKISTDELLKLKHKFEKKHVIINKIPEKSKRNTFIDDLKSKYKLNTNFIPDFVNFISSIIGKNQNLSHDLYIINHDHNGYPINDPINIFDDKIQFKNNHPFFNKNVIYFTNNKTQIDTFYDTVKKSIIGFKEKGKDYQYSRNKNAFLKINYSLTNKIKMFGSSSKYINIENKLEEYKKIYKNNKNKIIPLIIADVINNRITNLKKILTTLQRYIYRIIYNYTGIEKESDITEDITFLDKYKNKLTNIKITGKNQDKIFSEWKSIKKYIHFSNYDKINNINNIDINLSYIDYEIVNQYDDITGLIIYYIIDELHKLININDDKHARSNLVYLIIDIINHIFGLVNQDIYETNMDLKRFNYILFDVESVREIDDLTGELDGFYQEYKDTDDKENPEDEEKKDEDQEEMDAIDMEDELDYEIDYEPGVNFN
jgi:hypothetical protein